MKLLITLLGILLYVYIAVILIGSFMTLIGFIVCGKQHQKKVERIERDRRELFGDPD